jgi:hypothetical protein
MLKSRGEHVGRQRGEVGGSEIAEELVLEIHEAQPIAPRERPRKRD